MTDETPDWMDQAMVSPEYKLGYDLGGAFKEYDLITEAQKAYEAGEIEAWLEKYRPKTREEWHEYKGSDLPKRWLETEGLYDGNDPGLDLSDS